MRSTLKALTIAAVLAGFAGLADAAWRPRLRRIRRVRPIVRRRIVRPLPRKRIVVGPRVVKPLVVPTVTSGTTTVVVPAESPAATELKAEIATLKAKYAKLSTTRQTLRNWLAGPGKGHSSEERAKVQTHLAEVDRQCILVAAQIAALEQKLAAL